MSQVTVPIEAVERFSCFGGDCLVLVAGTGPAGPAPLAARLSKQRLLEWHHQFTRFDRGSELSQLNRDPRETVPVTPMMVRFVEAAIGTASLTGGLVDPTLVEEIERAGYRDHLPSDAAEPDGRAVSALAAGPAAPRADARWRTISVDRRSSQVSRPAGVQLDSGGIAKGLFGDVLAEVLAAHDSFVVAAAGDLRFGGSGRILRPIQVTSPYGAQVLHTFELLAGAAATSGTTKRTWRDAQGQPAHHLLDPASGRPAFTGIVQVTALAPTGVEAEARAKAALLAGREAASAWLPHGGLIVYERGDFRVFDPAHEVLA